MVNADGQGDFFAGIAPTCLAADDIEHDLGAADEASLGEALYIRTGSCSVRSTTSAASRVPRSSAGAEPPGRDRSGAGERALTTSH